MTLLFQFIIFSICLCVYVGGGVLCLCLCVLVVCICTGVEGGVCLWRPGKEATLFWSWRYS